MSPPKKKIVKPEKEFESTELKEISYDAIKPDVVLQLKEEKTDAIIEKALTKDQEPEPTEAIALPTKQEMETKLKPTFKMLFDVLNDWWDGMGIDPFTPEEEKMIVDLIFESTTIGVSAEALKDIEEQSYKIRIVIFVITAIVPRLVSMFFYYKKKLKKKG